MAMRANASSVHQKAPRSSSRVGWTGRRSSIALISLLIGGGMAYVYAMYLRSQDISPDSVYGYGFAIAGTLLLALVGAGYVARKRLHRQWSGLLHTALTWHIVGGMLGLALILMHAAGNFNPRTGTYALYSLIALVVSGVIGRQFDRIAPRLAVRAALTTLTPDGEERLEVLAGAVHETPGDPRGQRQSLSELAETSVPWDLAYHDLSARPGDIPALLTQPWRNTPGVAAQHQTPAPKPRVGSAAQDAMASESAVIRRALGRERFFLRLIRVWRLIHTALSVVTLALILWHLEYAATLLIGAR